MAFKNINPDLVKERASATFDVDKLTDIIYGGRNAVRRRQYLHNIVFQDKYLQSFNTPGGNDSREEKYDASVKKDDHVHKMIEDLNITDPEEIYIMKEAAISNDIYHKDIHFNMFIPTIEKLGTEEQIEKFLKPARQFKILGTYAQTELGHGTFIRGLETTATYDPATEEFVINSPTLTSMKFWPAALGKTSNYAVVIAQLYTGGKCYGIHSFVVQIRSLEDHRPMPGVTVGDIGSKMAFNGMDNGFLIFDNYRVPRDAMLMRYAKIERHGTYFPPTNTKLSYAVMVEIRATLVGRCAYLLSQVCTIAVRYSAVRHQSEIRPGEPEAQVIDYQTQQAKLFTNLAAAYAMLFCGTHIHETYKRITADVEKGQLEEVQVLHAVSAGLKALSSYTCCDGIDKLRMACGGHGYTNASGIPKIYLFALPTCTYEGENTVMYLQCSRYLMKCYEEASKGHKLSGFMTYLNNPVKIRSNLDNTCRMTDIVEAYEHTAARLIQVAAEKIQRLVKTGSSLEDARNQASVQMVKAAIAHSEMYEVKVFVDVLQNSKFDHNVAMVLEALCQLHAINRLNNRLGEFMKDGFISGEQADFLMNKQLALYAEIRPNAVALVDAFDYPDQILQSCIGRYDGQVYEALYEYAKNSPLNKDEVMDSYYTTLRPLMKGQLGQTAPPSRL